MKAQFIILDSSLAGVHADKIYTLQNDELSVLKFPSLEVISGPIKLEGFPDIRFPVPMAVISEGEIIVYNVEQGQLITYDIVTGAQVNNLSILNDEYDASWDNYMVCSVQHNNEW